MLDRSPLPAEGVTSILNCAEARNGGRRAPVRRTMQVLSSSQASIIRHCSPNCLDLPKRRFPCPAGRLRRAVWLGARPQCRGGSASATRPGGHICCVRVCSYLLGLVPLASYPLGLVPLGRDMPCPCKDSVAPLHKKARRIIILMQSLLIAERLDDQLLRLS